MTRHIPVIVITGAPNSGKGFVLKFLKKHFTDHGHQVIVIRKLADHFIQAGKGPSQVGMNAFQDHMLEAMLNEEWNAKQQLSHASKPLIFVERGGMDGAAHIPREEIEDIWSSHGRHFVHLRDERYTAVIQLIANPAMLTAEDMRIRAAWMGAPHFACITTPNLKEQCLRALAHVEYFLSGKEHEARYRLLIPFERSLLPADAQGVTITQYYVHDDDGKPPRIRSRGQDGYHVFTKGVKKKIDEMSSSDTDEPITEEIFESLQERRVLEFAIIVKTRWCFFGGNGWYFELDVLRDLPGLAILEVEMTDPSLKDHLRLPDGFDGNVEDITGSSLYSNKGCSRLLASMQQLAA